jgi:uncharacterized protein (DUF983 family)
MTRPVHRSPVASDRPRTTESPMEMPSVGRALRLLGRVVRLRCPHCGRGRVLSGFAGIRERCSTCGFHYERSDDNYFMGAMFFNFMMGTTLFAIVLFAIIAFSGPNIPWDTLQWAIPVALGFCMVALYPVSKIVWLAVDVMVRPVTSPELE